MKNLKDNLLSKIIEISRVAGDEILDIYGSEEFKVTSKADDSPLTKADIASHKIIKEALNKISPSIPILSEEESEISFKKRSLWKKYWLVDPLDGTKEFINRNGEFTVNIALIENNKSTMGVVHIPCKKETFFGDLEDGSFIIDENNNIDRLNINMKNDEQILLVSRSHLNEDQRRFLADQNEFTVMNRGSSLKFCLVASGIADVYIRLGPTSEWDTAAGEAVVKSAGGIVMNIDRSEIRYNEKSHYKNKYFIAAKNEQILEKSMLLIQKMNGIERS
jgi:3'(2'), 5'-bisphosphate nucleotidase